MNRLKQNNMIFWAASMSVHVMLLLVGVVFFTSTTKVPKIGNTAQVLINSYVYRSTSRDSVAPMTSSSKMLSRNLTVSNASSRNLTVSKTSSRSLTASRTSSRSLTAGTIPTPAGSTAHTGVQTQELLAILHMAIQQQQHYPASAMQMERQGKATITFVLFPNGSIQNVRMMKSSGTASLDQAALAAVQDAAPFKTIEKYLQSAQEFSIDVVFELG